MKACNTKSISPISGIQYAGGHLKELQRAVQDPISNFGVVLGEVAKRGRSAIGIRFVSSIKGGSVGYDSEMQLSCIIGITFCWTYVTIFILNFSSGNMLGSHVHPNLVDHAGTLCTNVEAFGGAIEKLLIKHGKNIIHEQFLLNRVAQVLYNFVKEKVIKK